MYGKFLRLPLNEAMRFIQVKKMWCVYSAWLKSKHGDRYKSNRTLIYKLWVGKIKYHTLNIDTYIT